MKTHNMPLFDALESRHLLSTDVVGAGAFFDGSFLTPYFVTGEVDDDGDVSALLSEAGSSGPRSPQPLGADGIRFLEGGRYDPIFAPWFEPYDSYNGAQFLNSQSYPAGWFEGVDSGYSRAEFIFVGEAASGVSTTTVQGRWEYSSLIVTDSEAFGAWGTLDISGSFVSRTTRSMMGSSSDSFSLTSVSSNGLIRTSDGTRAFLTADRTIGFAVDPVGSDGQVSLSVFIKPTSSATTSDLAGGYRVGTILTGEPAERLSGLEGAVRSVYLLLNRDGTYLEYDLDKYDLGQRQAIGSGTWLKLGQTLQLSGANGEDWEYTITGDGLALVPRFNIVGGDSFPTLGMATKVMTPGVPIFSVAGDDSGTGVAAFILDDDDQWQRIRLDAETGSPSIDGSLVTWTDAKDGLVYAAGETADGVVLYRQDDNGSWSYRHLSDELGGDRIVEQLDVMVAADGRVHLTGLDRDGDLIRYSQSTQTDVSGEYTWSAVNIGERDLRASGREMPKFADDLVTYATSWGGLNVAGLDADGDIWSVWWAPGLDLWRVTNLTEALGAEPLVGGLTVYLTPWDGINIAGIDADGQLQVTWWVPQFGGRWARSNLSQAIGGSALRPDSVSSYVSSWGGLNITGVDTSTNDVVVYWWTPARTQLGWAQSSLSGLVGDGVSRPVTQLRGLAASDSSLNVFGVSDRGDLIRYFWEPGFGGDWQGQNLTRIAT